MNGYVVIGLRAAVRAFTGSVEDPGASIERAAAALGTTRGFRP